MGRRQEPPQRHPARLDFRDAVRIFAFDAVVEFDDRRDYGEERFLRFGYLAGIAVVVVTLRSMSRASGSSRSEKSRVPKPGTSTQHFYSDIERLRAMTDDDIDLTDLPEVPTEWFRRARVVPGEPVLMTQFAVTLPDTVRQWFEEAPEGCDRAVAAALTEYMDRHAPA